MNEPTAVEYLKAARDRISDSNNWVTECYAVGPTGLPIAAQDEGAFRWCAEGALLRFMSTGQIGDEVDKAMDILEQASINLYNESVVTVNDEMGHAAVMKVYDVAISDCIV